MHTLTRPLVLVAGLFVALAVHAGSCDRATSTAEIVQCLEAESTQANEQLAQYLAAAQARIDKELGSKPDLTNTQAAWAQYRQLQCGDVYQFWIQGSYRSVASAACALNLTKHRTHELWQTYLTYPDSTPAVLPEPH